MATDDADLDDLSPEEEEKFSRYLDRALERRAAAKKRREAPGDFGELMDRFRDELEDTLEEYGLERKSPRERDDAPSRQGNDRRPPKSGGKRSFGEQFFGIGGEKAS